MSDEGRYGELLDVVSDLYPRLAVALRSAEEQRVERLRSYVDDVVRLKGLEQLFEFLDDASKAYLAGPTLAPLTFMINRTVADFETAIEASLSGYMGVAFDAMRDVMEIEALLLDFAVDQARIEEWLHADQKIRMKLYGPSKVRERLKGAGVAPFANDDFEPNDYRGHSEALHVTPPTLSLSPRGRDNNGRFTIFNQVGFSEMFEHAQRVAHAIGTLRWRVSGGVDQPPLAPRDDFIAGFKKAKESEIIVEGFMRAIAVRGFGNDSAPVAPGEPASPS